MRIICTAVVTLTLIPGLVGEALAQRNKTTCGPDVLVTVTIEGTYPGAPNSYSLVSDGAGVYSNSVRGDKLTAIFQVDNCTHDFTMNLNQSKRSMWALLTDSQGVGFVRRGNFFNFDRVHSVPVTPTTPAESSAFVATHEFCTGGVQRTADGQIKASSQGWYYDNYAGCGVDADGRAYVVRAGGVSLDPDERLGFNVSPLDAATACPDPLNPSCSASRVRVYHPDGNHWEVRPEAPASAAYRVWASGTYEFRGYQAVPFRITLTTP